MAFARATGIVNLLQRDQVRGATLKANGQARLQGRAGSVAATNAAEDYTVEVNIGSPGTSYTLSVDTGSFNTWVGAGKLFVSSSSTVDTGDSVFVSYGSGYFEGTEYDPWATGFAGVDGIIGVGPVDLTEGRFGNSDTVPTVTDNLCSHEVISEHLVAVSFEPTNGEPTFGGTNSSKYTGPIAYTSLTITSPASYYWGIDELIAYGFETILGNTAGIVDTGTTLILIASDAYSAYQIATGAIEDDNTARPANAQIWPRSLNIAIGGSSSDIYLVVSNIGSPFGEGFHFINAYTFLEWFYSALYPGNSRVGFPTTSYTDATTN
ncbi:Polyporopepsin [Sparassis crispa]|uniref:Polyporopepsin n=1 Tax=Sparassis crispa TaxID=139825 RepID=A0A401GGW7_9APHY|nr:Polyporopepsin [Sparassis crispa]GBE81427.1 Polyporopepsin [Sparassis crispa]